MIESLKYTRRRTVSYTHLDVYKRQIEDIAECVDFDEETVKKWLVS